ncbi:MAG: PSD1 and planctomycete cytochrome C domain-containing protein [Planctomycetes bacterium]|nr:PSD1 and planctomycete cytochrome C domain-containing protein [Planctomycetota bacterium]
MASSRPLFVVSCVTVFGVVAALGAASSGDRPAAAREPVRYDRDVRPILSDRCFKCHGFDAASRKAELRLDVAESAYAERDGGHALVPGDVSASAVLARIATDDPDEQMPPVDSHKRKLSADEVAVVRRWVEEGAKYEAHWSFVAPVKSAVPTTEHATRNEIDAFVLANLERHGLAPSAEAPRDVLLRRLFLDLTGLPPTPEELDAFLADTRPDAYERRVDQLLNEEPYKSRYAERMTAPWLDQARYADTSGIHMDAGRQIWPWRDWVLAAFRDDLPFDRFVIEQLAGDLLPNATQDQKIASGFNRNHVTTDEGGAIDEEYKVEYAADRVNTTGAVFLGLTVGCARCHDHKFDPVTQDEYYSLFAFYDSIEEPGLYSQVPDANRALEPFLRVPSKAQEEKLAALVSDLATATKALDEPVPGEDEQRAKFLDDVRARAGLRWAEASLASASSSGGATLTIQPDGSALASGTNPPMDDFTLTLRTQATDLRLVALEALTDERLPNARVGRAHNGNAVLTDFEVDAVSLVDASKTERVHFTWAVADFEQANGDFRVLNTIDASESSGWAVDGHNRTDGRAALFLADRPFGFAGGTELRVVLRHRSMYTEHTLGRVRVSFASIADDGIALLPTASSGWYLAGPFETSREKVFDTAFGPESVAQLDLAAKFDDKGAKGWSFVETFADDRANGELPQGSNASYVAKRVVAPSARKLSISLGSDDGARVFVDGREVFQKNVDRALAADQDAFDVELSAGEHAIVFKIVNTGGQGGFYWHAKERTGELAGDLVWAAGPKTALAAEREARFVKAWRVAESPGFRAALGRVNDLAKSIADVEASVPLTMVMKELAMPRDTYVLTRGQYDKPDKNRKVERSVPRALGTLPADAPKDRLGLAQWLVSKDNPLVARVAVNRLWELFFGAGLVRSSEDFGHQGEWPSNPELLDWLAVEFRDGDWGVKSMVKRIVTSATYRQSSHVDPKARELDPDDRWLAYYPRRRMGAEQIRDQALYVAGLLVEKFGGPSVKPYQPEGLWQEVAMLQSNTRVYERGMGDDLWRRSLYTYWKRACPPPSLMTFDAPTREFCTIRRPSTNTPLQALVLWNDEQYVEAARALAERSLRGSGDERAKLATMIRRATARLPNDEELALFTEALGAFRERFRAAPDDAKKLVAVGERATDMELDPVELAAWAMVAGALLDLDATLSQS